jgi:WD40 repeat protein
VCFKQGRDIFPPAEFRWHAGDLKQTCKAHKDQILHLSYSGDGRILLASSADHPATLWDPQLHSELGHLHGIREPVNNACWCGPNLAITDSEFEIHLHTATLDNQHKAEVLHKRTWSGHSDCVVDIDWAPNQWLLASCSEDRSVRLWGTHQVCTLALLIVVSDW